MPLVVFKTNSHDYILTHSIIFSSQASSAEAAVVNLHDNFHCSILLVKINLTVSFVLLFLFSNIIFAISVTLIFV